MGKRKCGLWPCGSRPLYLNIYLLLILFHHWTGKGYFLPTYLTFCFTIIQEIYSSSIDWKIAFLSIDVPERRICDGRSGTNPRLNYLSDMLFCTLCDRYSLSGLLFSPAARLALWVGRFRLLRRCRKAKQCLTLGLHHFSGNFFLPLCPTAG